MRFQKDVAVVDTMDFLEDPTALEAVVVLLRMSCIDQTMPCATRANNNTILVTVL